MIPKYDKLLILDLDETLIHSSEHLLERIPDFELDEYFVYKRPGVDQFLYSCAALFKIAVWTSSTSDYAQEIIKNVFPNTLRMEFVFTRERCLFRLDHNEGKYQTIKPLKKVRRRGYSLEKVLIIDDTPCTFKYNYGNAILVKEYQGEAQDKELFLLIQYLEKIATSKNVRVIDKRNWRNKIQHQ